MATEIKLPSLGEGIESGDVLEVLVKVGDVVKKEQSLLEMETDKATVSVPSPAAGKILSIAVKEGETVKVGQVFVTLEASSAPAAANPVVPAAPAQAAAPAAPVVAPAPVAPKPVAEAPSPAPVKPAPIVVPPAPVTPVATASVAAPAAESSPFGDDVIPAGPAIRRFAREVGVDLGRNRRWWSNHSRRRARRRASCQSVGACPKRGIREHRGRNSASSQGQCRSETCR